MDVVKIGRGTSVDNYSSVGTYATRIASGRGEGHVYRLEFDAGGSIGRHRAGFDQLFCVVSGAGWVEGNDGIRRAVVQGDVARFRRGETHAKGSDDGMAVVMVQLTDFDFDG